MEPSKNLVIGVDVSTTACKAIAWDPLGNPVAAGRASIPMITPKPNWHEQNANHWWLALQSTLREVCSKISLARLAGICICPQRETFVPVDSSGNPISNALLWMDERASYLIPTITTKLGAKDFHEITGKPVSGNLTFLKILWLKENKPEIFHAAAKFLDVAAFLNYKLTNNFTTGKGVADPTGLFDMQQEKWSQVVLNLTDLDQAQLPKTVSHGTIIGQVSEQTSQLCGLPVSLPVVAGVGDGQATGLGLNITSPGKSYLSLGTSVVSGSYTQDYVVSPAFRTLFAAEKGYSLETVILGGTYTLNWLQENFVNEVSLNDLEKQARKLPPGSDGLIVVPYWNSVLNPYWDAKARGITIGWHGSHRPEHFYRAILEGIAFELQLHFDGLENALHRKIDQVIVSGGGAQSDLWCQIIADISKKTIHRARVPEATALGAGILAAAGAGLFKNVREAAENMTAPPRQKFEPQPQNSAFYKRIFEEVYRPLFPAIQPLLRKLN